MADLTVDAESARFLCAEDYEHPTTVAQMRRAEMAERNAQDRDPLEFFDHLEPGHGGCALCPWEARGEEQAVIGAFIRHHYYRHEERT